MSEPPPDGAEAFAAFVEHSPFARHLGLELTAIEPDRARVRMPYRAELATAGDVVHGGAIGALIDVAATGAAWAGADLGKGRAATVAYTVDLLRPARGADLEARARVVRRGRSLCHVDTEVAAPGGAAVARGIVIYRVE